MAGKDNGRLSGAYSCGGHRGEHGKLCARIVRLSQILANQPVAAAGLTFARTAITTPAAGICMVNYHCAMPASNGE